MARYINPFSDWSFKRIFGQEYSKDLLIEFLNQLLLGEQHITNVKFKDKEMLPETKDQRGIIYDVFCTTDTGEHIIVEMQNKSQAYFIDRSLFYASKTIVDQGVKGQWDYHLTPVYVICFMNFDVDENTPKKFRTDVVLADKESGEVYSNKIRFIYLVMPLFKKKEEECNTFLDCWIYNLKHMETLEKMPFEAQHKIFKRLAEIADSKTLTKEEQEKYDNSMMVMWDNYAVYKHAEEKGIIKGEAKGRAEGRVEGRAEGEKKLVDSKSVVSLLENKLVLIKGKDTKTVVKGISNITDAKMIAVGDPEVVPAGQYAKIALTHANSWDAIQNKISLGGNVTEVLSWVESGSAEVGLVYSTDAASSSKVTVLEKVNNNLLDTPVIYPVGRVTKTKHQEEANNLITFLETKGSKETFKKSGFTICK